MLGTKLQQASANGHLQQPGAFRRRHGGDMRCWPRDTYILVRGGCPALRAVKLLILTMALLFTISAAAHSSDIIINDINHTISNAEKKLLQNLIDKQIRFHRTHYTFREPVVLNIRLFATNKEFLAYRDKDSGSQSNTGWYSSKKKEIVVNKTKREYFQVLLHEAQHAIFRSTGTKAPKWLNEGLSEFFAQSYEENGTVFVKADVDQARKVKRYRERNNLTPLSKLVNLSDKGWDSQFKANNFKYYAECWSLIYFLMVDKQSRQRHDLVNILRDLKKGSRLSTLDAINRRYPGGIAALERDWQAFIGSSSFNVKVRYQTY